MLEWWGVVRNPKSSHPLRRTYQCVFKRYDLVDFAMDDEHRAVHLVNLVDVGEHVEKLHWLFELDPNDTGKGTLQNQPSERVIIVFCINILRAVC